MAQPSMPGANPMAYAMMPLRVLAYLFFLCLMWPLATLASILRACFLRIKVGAPSKVLKYGTYPHPKVDGPGRPTHAAAVHYPAQFLFTEPLNETKLHAAVVSTAKEDGIAEDEVEVKIMPEVPTDWPSSGSYDVSSALLPKTFTKGMSYLDELFGPPLGKAGGWKHKIKVWVYNNAPGKPTVMHFGGSAEGWDGSSNFNFVKEVMRRYSGLTAKPVFAKPEISSESAAKFDSESFLYYLAKLPINTFRNVSGAVWSFTRAARWAGGNAAFKPGVVSMNFTNEESAKLARGCKKLGAKPFAAFTHAAHKAMKEVVGQTFTTICNQASLQTRHYPVEGQGAERDFVGDWLVGVCTQVGEEFSLADATADYKKMIKDLDEAGPLTRAAFMAKAYGVANSGAAGFECMPTYNDNTHLFSRTLFMNNYGVRTMPPESPFHTWNWNAPMWLGVNTISVNGKTTTLVGSSVWGLEIVEQIRDNMEVTLRGIMKEA